jgi:putative addiction module killer protein
MNRWTIRYWTSATGKNPIEKWFDGLTKEQLKSVAKELEMLEEAGNALRLPHSKSLGEKLFELRERRYGYRVYYCFHGKLLIILLAAGDKTSQEKDIKMARDRLSKL